MKGEQDFEEEKKFASDHIKSLHNADTGIGFLGEPKTNTFNELKALKISINYNLSM